MRTLLDNLREDQRAPVLDGVKCGGRYIVNDLGQAIAEIETLTAELRADPSDLVKRLKSWAMYLDGHVSAEQLSGLRSDIRAVTITYEAARRREDLILQLETTFATPELSRRRGFMTRDLQAMRKEADDIRKRR